MRSREFVNELFNPNKALPYKWENAQRARAALPDGRALIVNIRPSSETEWSKHPYSIEFSVGDDFEMTGGGEVSTIFATVIEIVKAFIQKQRTLVALYFTAEEQSRAKMYDTLAKRVAKQVGWHVVPYDEMVQDPKYKTPLSYGDFLFAIEPGLAPEHRQDAQEPQHGEFLPIYYVYSLELTDLPAIKIKAKKGYEAETWVIHNVPGYKDADLMGMAAVKSPPQGKKIIDMGTVPVKPKPVLQDPNSLGAKLRAKLDTPL